jgi:hypothetical protein
MNESNGLNPLEKFHQAVATKSSSAAGFFVTFFTCRKKVRRKKVNKKQ